MQIFAFFAGNGLDVVGRDDFIRPEDAALFPVTKAPIGLRTVCDTDLV